MRVRFWDFGYSSALTHSFLSGIGDVPCGIHHRRILLGRYFGKGVSGGLVFLLAIYFSIGGAQGAHLVWLVALSSHFIYSVYLAYIMLKSCGYSVRGRGFLGRMVGGCVLGWFSLLWVPSLSFCLGGIVFTVGSYCHFVYLFVFSSFLFGGGS